jgi:putative ABC transport system permease protein
MKAFDVVDLARRNLRESLLRNSLTTLGISVGIASLVAMLSLGIGLQQLANRRLTSSGLFDSILVSARREVVGSPQRQREEADRRLVIDDAARSQMAKLPNVVEVFPDVRFMTEVRYAEKPSLAVVAGLPPSAKDNEALEDVQGKFFSGPSVDEALLLSDFAKQLDPKVSNLIGQSIVMRYAERQGLADNSSASGSSQSESASEESSFSVTRRDRSLRIVGIIDQEPYSGFRGMSRSNVFIPTQLAEELNVMQPADLRVVTNGSTSTRAYSSLTVRVAGPGNVQAVEDQIKQMGFGTFSLLDAARNLRRFFAVLDLFLGIFGSLALAVAALGIINTLVMAILERRREIGIMKALGASDRDVKRLFFAEAGSMGLIGGLCGVALGWAIGRVIDFGTTIYLRRQELPPEHIWSVPWWLVAGAVAFSVAVTLVSGLYPAARAAKLDPVQALRYE